MTLGTNIKQARLNAGLTQKELADKLGTTYQAISTYEKGNVENIPMVKLRKMAEILGVTPEYLLGWEIKKPITLDGLSDSKAELIQLVQSLSEEEVQAVLRILKR